MSPISAKTSVMTPTSSNLNCSVEVHLFACGHGDTLLLRLPIDKWILIDCRLSKSDGTYDRFLDYLETNGVKRLEFVFQTHPDFDHFQGMGDLLKHFTTGGRSIGTWCDAGVNVPQVRDIAWKDDISRSRYSDLHKILDELDQQNLIGFREINDQVKHISPKDFPEIRLYPLAPTAADKRTIGRSDVAALVNNPEQKLETNALSIVLVLAVRHGAAEFNVLLSGDADPDKLDQAINTWEKIADEDSRVAAFNSVKLSHHGSPNSHLPRICLLGHGTSRIAAVSAGSRRNLPAATVLKEWQDAGWTVLSTTTRRKKRSPNRPGDLVNKRPQKVMSLSSDIKVTWTPSGGIIWTPVESQVLPVDLSSYT